MCVCVCVCVCVCLCVCVSVCVCVCVCLCVPAAGWRWEGNSMIIIKVCFTNSSERFTKAPCSTPSVSREHTTGTQKTRSNNHKTAETV